MKIISRKSYLIYNFDYFLDAGLVLDGTEVKSIRKSSPSLGSSFCFLQHGEVFLRDLNLSNAKNPDRDRKLLLHKKEIKKLIGFCLGKSKIIVPVEFYDQRGWFKIKIGIGERLKKYDVREKIKARDCRREERRVL